LRRLEVDQLEVPRFDRRELCEARRRVTEHDDERRKGD